MLELAAKAAGHVWRRNPYMGHFEIEGLCPPDGGDGWITWNPLDSDGDALRLAVHLDMQIAVNRVDGHTQVIVGAIRVIKLHGDDMYADTRFAITKAAAEIGGRM